MIALFGNRWTSQFGEKIDASGQWAETLKAVSRKQVAQAIEVLRNSGRVWPPTAPEFKSICLANGANHPTVEAAYAEVHRYMLGKISENDLSDAAFHTIHTNMDLYQYRSLSLEKSQDVFRFAYKATLDQFNSGEKVYQKPVPPIAIAEIKPVVTAEEAEKARAALFALFNQPEEQKQLTEAERLDLEKLNKVRGSV